MRHSMCFLMLLVVVVVGFAIPASAAQSLTTDKVVAIAMAGDVYWANQKIWEFQVLSGSGNAPQPVVVPPGATIKYRLKAVGTDSAKPIIVSVDCGKGEMPASEEIPYFPSRSDVIVVRTVYVGAVHESRPLIKIFISIGKTCTDANTKYTGIFPVNITNVMPVNCADEAKMSMLISRSAGTPVNMCPVTLAPKVEVVEKPAPPQIFADGPTTDDNFAKQGEMNQLLLQRDDAVADGLQANDQGDKLRDARLDRLENAWQAQTRPAVSAVPAEQDFAMTIAQKNAGKVGVIFAVQPGCSGAVYRIWTRRGSEENGWGPWDPQPCVLKLAPGIEAIWRSSISTLVNKGYTQFGVALEQSGRKPAVPYPLDPNSLRVILLQGGE